jgi:outer membrane protein assembly factor BamB
LHPLRDLGRLLLLLAVTSCALSARAEVTGWRGGGAGDFAGSQAPKRWSKSEGVRWVTPLRGRSNASPIVVGSRVFVLDAPAALVAVDADKGGVLWRREHPVVDFLPASEAARLKPLLAAADQQEEQLEALRKEIAALKRQARRGPAAGRVAAKAALEQKEPSANELKRGLDALEVYRNREARGVVGYTSPTPVSDGKRVYTLLSNGVIAAYTLSGEKRWGRWLGEHTIVMTGFHSGQTASPALVDGVLVVPYADLLGLDPATGEERWNAGPYPHFSAPTPHKVGGDWVLVMPDGQVRRARDGKELRRPRETMYFVSPVVSAGMVIFAGTAPGGPLGANQLRVRAERMRLQGPDALVSDVVWEKTLPKTTEVYAQATAHDGLLYVIAQGAIRAFDVTSGELVFEENAAIVRDPVFASPMVTSDTIYVHSADGSTALIAPGRVFRELGVNSVGEGFWASPIISGGHIFVRSFERLWCIGP